MHSGHRSKNTQSGLQTVMLIILEVEKKRRSVKIQFPDCFVNKEDNFANNQKKKTGCLTFAVY